jgi:fumarylpyruvate hydrolase
MNDQKSLNFIFPPILRGISIEGRDELFPVGKIYCVGRNYEDHAQEMNGSIDKDKPFFFSKPPQAITQLSKIPFPSETDNLHHEVELVVCLKSRCTAIEPSQAHQYIFGYAVGIDLTKRDLQNAAKNDGKPWDLSKGFDNSAPISAIAEKDGVILKEGKILLNVNGEEKQFSDIQNMAWGVDHLISWLSKFITLKPGDIIFTGTPAGVGQLNPGDKIEASIENVGALSCELI